MLMVPTFPGFLETVSVPASTSAAGTTITASATPHTKGSWTQLVANTGARSLGILVQLDNTAGSNTNTSMLLDIGMGAAGAEQVIIPDLAAGFILPQATSAALRTYVFPLFIPAGVRLAARCQAVIASDTVACGIQLFQRPVLPGFVGSRVTAYGVDAANSRGVSATTGATSAYGTAATLSASTANPIKYMQAGLQAAGRSALTDLRVYADIRIGASASIAGPLVGFADTGTESVDLTAGNRILQGRSFGLPAGVDLRWAAMHNSATAAAYDMIVYGLD